MKSLKKPNFFVNTRRGMVYQLTPFYQNQYINNVQISMGDFIQMESVLSNLAKNNLSFKQYLGYKDQLLYVSPIDHHKTKPCLKGKNKADTVSMLGQNGYIDITNSKYIQFIEQMHPEIAVQLTEFSSGNGKGSSTRAVEKSVEFLDQIIAKVQELNQNKGDKNKISVYGSIQGGLYEDLRETATQNLCVRDVEGAVIHGLCQEETLQQRQNILQIIEKNISEEKKGLLNLVLSGLGNPIDILHALQFDIHYFEVEYPFKMAEYGLALNLKKIDVNQLEKTMQNEDKETKLFENKKASYFDLKDHQTYKDEVHEIVEKCECYTCQNHTLAYIAHLFKCHELTGHVLVAIHNIHTYNVLFSELQQALEQGKMAEYTQKFMEINTKEDNSDIFKVPVADPSSISKLRHGKQDKKEQKQKERQERKNAKKEEWAKKKEEMEKQKEESQK